MYRKHGTHRHRNRVWRWTLLFVVCSKQHSSVGSNGNSTNSSSSSSNSSNNHTKCKRVWLLAQTATEQASAMRTGETFQCMKSSATTVCASTIPTRMNVCFCWHFNVFVLNIKRKPSRRIEEREKQNRIRAIVANEHAVRSVFWIKWLRTVKWLVVFWSWVSLPFWRHWFKFVQ